MSEIKKLIERLCPDGVEYKKLGEVLDYEQPSKYIVSSKDYLDEGIPVLTAGQTFILGYTDEDTGIYRASKEKPVIIFDDFTTSFHWVTFDFKVKSSAMKMLRPINNDINFRFIYYAMKCIKYETADHARQWISKYSLFEIPVPPIEVQSKIVEILDNFTELEAELEARRKQYEYYRNQLLTFDKVGGARFEKLGNLIISLKTGLNPRKNFLLNEVGSNKPYITGKDIFANRINVTDKTDMINDIAVKLINKRACLESGLLLFASTGTGTVGRMAIIEKYNNDWAMSETLYAIKTKDELSSKFLMHFLYSDNAKKQFEPKISKGSVPHLKVVDLLNVVIPIPPLSEQQRIVSILDRFEALTTDLQSGLPAEIEARRKQYEYYREQLLTFKRKTA